MKIVADANIPYVQEVFEELGTVHKIPGRRLAPDHLWDADMLLVRSTTWVDARLLERSTVKFIGSTTAGTDHVDLEYLKKNNIAFAHAPGSNAGAVSDYVTLALLEIAARLDIRLQGEVFGIIGYGEIGSRVANRARSLGMEVIVNDPPLAYQTGHKRFKPLEEIWKRAKVVSFHVPLTYQGPNATYQMANESFFERLSQGCILINTARGDVIDEDALLYALNRGYVAAAILDVWKDEPAPNDELVKKTALATPHIAGHSLEGKLLGLKMVYEAACKFMGEDSTFEVFKLPKRPAILHPGKFYDSPSHEEMLTRIIRMVYDLRKDHKAMQRLADIAPTERAKAFDKARRSHGPRREFSAYQVDLPFDSLTLRGALAAMEFQIGGD